MPSSRTAPACPQRVDASDASLLLELLDSIPDPRRPRGARHSLPGLLAVALAAVVCGARSFAAIGQWVGDVDADLATGLGFDHGKRHSESAIRRAFGRLDASTLDKVLGSWMWTRTRVVERRRVIAIDGKTIRGARTQHSSAPHLVAAYDHTSGTVLGQLAVATKSNEIPAVRTLLAGFDLAGVVVTVDAMHTQTDTAQVITEAGGDYVFTIKGTSRSCTRPARHCPGHSCPPAASTSRATAAE